jgi:hypothetical protein
VTAVFPGAVATVQNWASHNGCTGPLWDTEPTLELDLTTVGLETSVLRFTNSPPGGAVELWSIRGGGHSPLIRSGNRDSGFSERIIDWFLAHPNP